MTATQSISNRRAGLISAGAAAKVLLLSILLAACASAMPPETGEARELTLKPFIGKLRTIDVEIDGKAVPFLFDTGGGLTFIDPKYTRALGCKPRGRVTGYRMDGERIDSKRCGVTRLPFGSFALEAEAAVLDINALLPEGLPELGGVLSLQTFAGQAITLDFEANRIFFESEQALANRTGRMTEVPVRLTGELDGFGFAMYLEIEAGGLELLFLLDSSNLRPTRIAPHALDLLSANIDPGTDLLDLLLAPGLTYQTKYEVADLIHDGALDFKFFDQFLVTMDLGAGKLWLKRR